MTQLAECLVGYVTYVTKKGKAVSDNQKLPIPVRSFSENIYIYYLPLINTAPSSLDSLSLAIEAKVEYQEVFVNDFAPSEPLQRHRYIECLKKGLPFHCLLCLAILLGAILEINGSSN